MIQTEPLRTCKGCGEAKQLSSEYYSRRHNKCKSCMRKARAAEYRQKKQGSTKRLVELHVTEIVQDVRNKRCSYQWPETHSPQDKLPSTWFPKRKDGRLNGYCFDCCKIYQRKKYNKAPQSVHVAVDRKHLYDIPVGSPYDQVMRALADLESDGPTPDEVFERICAEVRKKNNMPQDSRWPRDFNLSAI